MIEFLLGALTTIVSLVFVWLIFYTAGHGWTLGTERAKRKARKEEE